MLHPVCPCAVLVTAFKQEAVELLEVLFGDLADQFLRATLLEQAQRQAVRGESLGSQLPNVRQIGVYFLVNSQP